MNKEELKSSLSKITPPEELIQATLLKVEEQKRKAEKPTFSFWSSSVYKYAAAFCVLFLIFGIGIASVINNGKDSQDVNNKQSGIERRNVQGTDAGQNPDIVGYMLADDMDEDLYEVQGTLEACYLAEVTAVEQAEGVIACGILEVAPFAGGDNIIAKMYFYDYETLNTLTSAISKGISFSLIPEADDSRADWRVKDFLIKAAK